MRRALTNAVVAQLRDTVINGGLALGVAECGLTPVGGQPPPMAGERYVGVRAGGRSTQGVTHGLLEEYSVIVTVTWRINGRIPFDRIGDYLMTVANGFDDLCDAVRLNIHGDQWDGRIISRANTIIGSGAGTGGPFATSLFFQGDDEPFPVSGEWFHAKPEAMTGIVQHLRFGGAQRVQSYASTQGVT